MCAHLHKHMWVVPQPLPSVEAEVTRHKPFTYFTYCCKHTHRDTHTHNTLDCTRRVMSRAFSKVAMGCPSDIDSDVDFGADFDAALYSVH